MKKILVLITAFLIAHQVSNAQTAKGDQSLGFNLGYSYSKDNNFIVNPNDNSSGTLTSQTKNFNIGPEYSYFVADKLDIGFDFYYGASKLQYTTDNPDYQYNLQTQSGKNYTIGATIRKYFMLNDKIGFRAGPYLNYEWGNTQSLYSPSNSIQNSSVNSQQFIAAAYMDLMFYPTKKIGFALRVAGFTYDHFKSNSGNQGHDSQDSFYLNFVTYSPSFSIFYVFGS